MLFIRRCAGLLLACSLVGCVALQDCEYRAAQQFRAHTAWWCCDDQRCTWNPWAHHSCGWRQGYADVLMGGNGECPPVPPQCYWSHKYQSECGEAAIEDWFCGYSIGAASALNSGRGHYNSVPLSNTFRHCGPGCLATDTSPYDFGRTTLGVGQPTLDNDDEEEDSAPGASFVPPMPAGTPMPDEEQTSARAKTSNREVVNTADFKDAAAKKSDETSTASATQSATILSTAHELTDSANESETQDKVTSPGKSELKDIQTESPDCGTPSDEFVVPPSPISFFQPTKKLDMRTYLKRRTNSVYLPASSSGLNIRIISHKSSSN